MATVSEREAKRKGRNGGILIGVLSTIVGGVIIKKTCGKNIIDGAEKVYDGAKSKVKTAIDDHKKKKEE